MKILFNLVLLASMGSCFAGDVNAQKIAAAKKLLAEVYDSKNEQLRGNSVKDKSKMHELQQLAVQIGLRDNETPEGYAWAYKSKDPLSLCRFYHIEFQSNPKFKEQSKAVNEEQKINNADMGWGSATRATESSGRIFTMLGDDW